VWEGNSGKLKYYKKFIAANIISFIPWSGIDLSFGNSVVYSADNIQAQFLIPFLFYVSVDANVSTSTNFAGNNNQMFFDFSIRKIKYLHFYGSLFIDEINLSKITDPAKQSNLLGLKAGFELTGFPFRNLGLTFEYTRTNPLVYKHFVPTTTFYNDQYSLGNYLRDNSQEFFVSLNYSHLRGLQTCLFYILTEHGTDYPYEPGANQGFLFLDDVVNKNQVIGFNISYQIINQGKVFLNYQYQTHFGDIDYIPGLFRGSSNTLIAGFCIDF